MYCLYIYFRILFYKTIFVFRDYLFRTTDPAPVGATIRIGVHAQKYWHTLETSGRTPGKIDVFVSATSCTLYGLVGNHKDIQPIIRGRVRINIFNLTCAPHKHARIYTYIHIRVNIGIKHSSICTRAGIR